MRERKKRERNVKTSDDNPLPIPGGVSLRFRMRANLWVGCTRIDCAWDPERVAFRHSGSEISPVQHVSYSTGLYPTYGSDPSPHTLQGSYLESTGCAFYGRLTRVDSMGYTAES